MAPSSIQIFRLLVISVLHISESTNNMNLIILVEQILSLKCTFWSNLLIVTKQTRSVFILNFVRGNPGERTVILFWFL